MGYLRLWLALVVVITHSGPPYILGLLQGHAAVNLFFCLSGFYMAMIYEERYGGRFVPFILSRWTRFYPPYWIVLALSLILLWWVRQNSLSLQYAPQLFNEPNPALSFGARVYILVSMLFQWGIEWSHWIRPNPDGSMFFSLNYKGTAIHLAAYQPVLQAWSLGIEELFCLTLPLWLKRSTAWLTAMVLLGMLLRFACILMGMGTFTVAALPPLGFTAFFSGILAWRFQVWRKPGLGAPAVAAAVLMLYFVVMVPMAGIDFFQSAIGFVGVLNGLILLSIVALGPLWQLSRSWPWERVLGELSYPLYLVHFLARWIWELIHGPDHDSWGYRIPYLLLSMGLALALLYGVIKPIDRWRHRRFLVPKVG